MKPRHPVRPFNPVLPRGPRSPIPIGPAGPKAPELFSLKSDTPGIPIGQGGPTKLLPSAPAFILVPPLKVANPFTFALPTTSNSDILNFPRIVTSFPGLTPVNSRPEVNCSCIELILYTHSASNASIIT